MLVSEFEPDQGSFRCVTFNSNYFEKTKYFMPGLIKPKVNWIIKLTNLRGWGPVKFALTTGTVLFMLAIN